MSMASQGCPGAGLTAEQRHRIEENKRKALALRAARQSSIANTLVAPRPPGGAALSPRHTRPQISATAPRVPTISAPVHSQTCVTTTRVPSAPIPGVSYISSVRPPPRTILLNAPPVSTVVNKGTGQFYGSTKPPATKTQTCIGEAYRKTHSASTLQAARSPQKHVAIGNAQSPVKPPAPSPHCSPVKSQKLSGKCALVSRYRFMVEIGYSAPLISIFKSMSTKHYDPQSKRWSFELQEYSELMKKIRNIGDNCIQVEPLPKAVLTAFDAHIHGNVAERRIPVADLSRVCDNVVSTLMPFQREGVNFAIWRGGRVLIADDMGLGKTLQAICVASYYRHEWPLLIVAPSSVRFTWREQLLRWLADSIDPQQINVVSTGKQSSTSGLINITSYDLMARGADELSCKNFRVIIMDESHLLKNSKTARSKVAAPLLKKAKRVILLTGTPALSRPSELFVQINAVNHKAFPRFHEFGLRYCNGQQLPWGWDFSGSSHLEELQLILEECVMIRRMKKDVMHQLPPKTRQMVVLDPGSVKVNKVMKQSHRLVDQMKGSERRGALLQYFHDTGTSKIPAVREYILDLLEADRKILVFAHHQVVLDALEEAVVAKKHQLIRIDGRNSSEQRNFLCNKFQTVDDVRVAILSITAANAGLHLTAASVVVFAELFWNPGILMQAEDRAHRMGQEDSVNVHYLVARNTADDYIWPLVQQKLHVLGKAGLSKDNFSNADTKYLKDPKQRDLLQCFEESFLESGDLPPEDSTDGHESEPVHLAVDSRESGSSPQKNILHYFKSLSQEQKSDACQNEADDKQNEVGDDTAEGDWLDDIEGLFDDEDGDDPDAPWPPKRQKT